jgi:hypothetical protein
LCHTCCPGLVDAKERKVPLYISNLDIQKAFHVVPHDPLLRDRSESMRGGRGEIGWSGVGPEKF